MGAATLVLVFCLISSPGSCQEERPELGPMSAASCLYRGQQYAAEWLADHPKWMLDRWRCEGEGKPKEQPT